MANDMRLARAGLRPPSPRRQTFWTRQRMCHRPIGESPSSNGERCHRDGDSCKESTHAAKH